MLSNHENSKELRQNILGLNIPAYKGSNHEKNGGVKSCVRVPLIDYVTLGTVPVHNRTLDIV